MSEIGISRREKRQNMMFVIGLVVLLIAMGMSVRYRALRMQKLPYDKHMDEVIVVLDGQEYKLKDMAFYLAYQEMITQEQAKVYDLEHPQKYWGVHANGSFIKIKARDAAMDMLLHDEIFYKMALNAGTTLTEEEQMFMKNQVMDFWNDLEEEGQKRLGVSIDEMEETFEHMALAQKKQQLLAEVNGVDAKEYDVSGSRYAEILQKHTYEINEKLWKRLNFGKIVLN